MNNKVVYKISKINNEKKIVLVKSGAFYKTYDEDAVILWGILRYRIIDNVLSIPSSIIKDVITKLNGIGLSLVIIDKEDVKSFDTELNNAYDSYLENFKSEFEFETNLNDLKEILEIKVNKSKDNFGKIEEFLKAL